MNRSWDIGRPHIDPHVYGHLTFDKDIKAVEWRNKACFQRGMLGQPYKN